MDNSISSRFFHIETLENGGGGVEDILTAVAENDLKDRERNIGAESSGDVIARLEQIEIDGDFFFGELIRRQVSNKPPEANESGLQPLKLSDGGGLGHSVAFRIHRPTSTLALQNNPSGISVGRFKAYLTSMRPQSKFNFERVPTSDAITRFNSGDARSFEIEIASPFNLPAIEGDSAEKTVIEASRQLAEAFNGMTVTVQVSMGRSKDNMPKEPVLSAITGLVNKWRGSEADIRKLRVKSKNTDGESGTEVINFLEEFLQERDSTDLPDTDVVRNYQIRRDFISLWHNRHLPYLEGLYRE